MLEEFSYLGKKKAYEVVVTNTNLVAYLVRRGAAPCPTASLPPSMENSAEELYSLVCGQGP